MMKYLEMNIKSKTFLTKQYALRLETNTRKIKSNIDKYTGGEKHVIDHVIGPLFFFISSCRMPLYIKRKRISDTRSEILITKANTPYEKDVCSEGQCNNHHHILGYKSTAISKNSQ